jgi:hypothetical protein
LGRSRSQLGVQVPVPAAVNPHLNHAETIGVLPQDFAQLRLG